MEHLDSMHMAFVKVLMYFLKARCTFLCFNIVEIKMLKLVSTFNAVDRFLSSTALIHSKCIFKLRKEGIVYGLPYDLHHVGWY